MILSEKRKLCYSLMASFGFFLVFFIVQELKLIESAVTLLSNSRFDADYGRQALLEIPVGKECASLSSM